MPATITGFSVDPGASPGASGGFYNIGGGDVTFVPSSTPADTLWLLAIVAVGTTGLDTPDPLRFDWPEPTTPTDWTVITNEGWWVGITDNIANTTFEGFSDPCGIAWVSWAITGWDTDGPSLYPGLGIAGITVAAQQADNTPYVLDPSTPTFGGHVDGRSIVQIAGDGFQRDGGAAVTPAAWTEVGATVLGWDDRIEPTIGYTSGTSAVASTLPGRDSATEAAESPPNANWTWPVLTPAAIAIEFTDPATPLNDWTTGIFPQVGGLEALQTSDGWTFTASVSSTRTANISPNYILTEVLLPVEMGELTVYQRTNTIDDGLTIGTWSSVALVDTPDDSGDYWLIRTYWDDIDWGTIRSGIIEVTGTATGIIDDDITINAYLVEPTANSSSPLLTPIDIWDGVYP